MKRPSRKDIQAAVEKLREKPVGDAPVEEPKVGRLTPAQKSQRIRKKGI